jgi:uncharacterized protein
MTLDDLAFRERATHFLAIIVRVVLVMALVIFAHREAHAYTPPALEGAVMDTASTLSASDKKALESKLAAYRTRTTNEIVVFVLASLKGESIEDVAYGAFNSWKIGRRGKDNGVLLVVALADHKLRIETGKGVEDRLTDLQSSDINRARIAPLLRQGRTYDAIVAGVDGIEAALDGRPAPPLPSAAVAAPSVVDTSPDPYASHLAGGPYWYRYGSHAEDDEQLRSWNAKAAGDRAHWDRLAIVIASDRSELKAAEASIRDQRGDEPMVVRLGYHDGAVEVSEGKGPAWGESYAPYEHAERLAERLRHRLEREKGYIEDDLAEQLGNIAIADLDRAVKPPPPERHDSSDTLLYVVFGVIASIFASIIGFAFFGRGSGGGSSSGDGGGSSSSNTSSFDNSSSSSMSDTSSSSSSSDTSYTGGGGSSGGGGSTDSW